MYTEVINENISNKPLHQRKRIFKKRYRDHSAGNYRKVVPIHESETSLCVALWRAVIVQALYDISGSANGEVRKMARIEANEWLSNIKKASNDNGETDFEYVCGLANISPALVLRMAKEAREGVEIINDGYNSRTFRKKYSTRAGRRVFNKEAV